jgi:hypothetical protein
VSAVLAVLAPVEFMPALLGEGGDGSRTFVSSSMICTMLRGRRGAGYGCVYYSKIRPYYKVGAESSFPHLSIPSPCIISPPLSLVLPPSPCRSMRGPRSQSSSSQRQASVSSPREWPRPTPTSSRCGESVGAGKAWKGESVEWEREKCRQIENVRRTARRRSTGLFHLLPASHTVIITLTPSSLSRSLCVLFPRRCLAMTAELAPPPSRPSSTPEGRWRWVWQRSTRCVCERVCEKERKKRSGSG